MTETVPIIALPPAPPALNFGGNNFDCWVLVGGFNLETADVTTSMLALPKFADALDAHFKVRAQIYKMDSDFLNQHSFYDKFYFCIMLTLHESRP